MALALSVAAVLAGTAIAAKPKPRPKPLPVTATFEISSTERFDAPGVHATEPAVVVKITRADRCRSRAPSPVTFRIGSGVYTRANVCNPYFTAPKSWYSNGVTTWLSTPDPAALAVQLPRGSVAFDPFWSTVFFMHSGNVRTAPIGWHSTDPRTKTWDIPISVVSNGKVVASAIFEASYVISGDVVPARRITDDDIDNFINICIHGTYTLWSSGGHLYCDVPEGFQNVRTALSLVRK